MNENVKVSDGKKLPFNEHVKFGISIGKVLEDESSKRIIKFFIDNGNKPSYHNEIFNSVRGSKTTVSNSLHILRDEYRILESKYEQIDVEKPTKRVVSVLNFRMKTLYYNFFTTFFKGP